MEQVIVFKDKQSREIHTYVNEDGHGARMNLEDFIGLVAEQYGSPATTFTRSAFSTRLQAAAARAIYQMKEKTKAVAAVNREPS